MLVKDPAVEVVCQDLGFLLAIAGDAVELIAVLKLSLESVLGFDI